MPCKEEGIKVYLEKKIPEKEPDMEQLLQDLKQENYKNAYLLCGEEAYLRNQYKKRLRDALP